MQKTRVIYQIYIKRINLVVEKVREEKGYYKYEYIIRKMPLEVLKEKNNLDTQKGYADTGDSKKQIDKTYKI